MTKLQGPEERTATSLTPPSGFVAFLSEKCPQCRTGQMYKYPIFHPRFSVMYEHCPNCGLKYEIEPGFFWGAMYFSYGITVGISIVTAILVYNFLNDPSVLVYLAWIGGICLLFSSLIFRYSRSMMLYLFGSVKFRPELYRKK